MEISKQQFCQDHKSGMKHKDIAAKYDISVPTVNKYVQIFRKEGLLPEKKKSKVIFID